jgi:hypothetical protein
MITSEREDATDMIVMEADAPSVKNEASESIETVKTSIGKETEQETESVLITETVEVVESFNEENQSLLATETLTNKQGGWNVEFLAGPSVNYRVFHSDANPELASHKNANDRNMMSTNMSLLLRRQLNDKWSVATGIQTFNCGEKYSYTVNSATHNFDNTYNYLSIPLEVDYTVLRAEGLRLDFGLGAQYNHLREGTSSWVDLDSEQPVTHNNKGKESPFN